MAPQLQLNQGPQDALLYDNTRSYFTNVPYVRTSNFQLELKDIDPQNSAQLGTTAQFVIPKAADLLGPVDLMVQFSQDTTDTSSMSNGQYCAWVENLGMAMIERITFSVGSHDIETLTGEHLNIINELMRTDEHRLGSNVLKTGRPAVEFKPNADPMTAVTASTSSKRIIYQAGQTTAEEGASLIVPLGLYFTKHPSKYFPLVAIAGCNDIRISIKFRALNELIVRGSTDYDFTSGKVDISEPLTNVAPEPKGVNILSDKCKLRCHYVHVTGPEATTLMNKEHVTLLKLWQVVSKPISSGDQKAISVDLSFLHPVQEMIITIRKTSEISSTKASGIAPEDEDQGVHSKNLFAYHGSGKDPNVESIVNKLGAGLCEQKGGVDLDKAMTLKVKAFRLSLNGQERHPSLAQNGVDRDYLMNRLMPMLHSNTSHTFSDIDTAGASDLAYLGEMLDRKEIYVYPFALNPEGANPSGAVNFSKVSHGKLTIELNAAPTAEYQVDVYGLYYNWLQIKDGRALTSFA